MIERAAEEERGKNGIGLTVRAGVLAAPPQATVKNRCPKRTCRVFFLPPVFLGSFVLQSLELPF